MRGTAAPVALLTIVLLLTPFAGGHTFNHMSQHEDCLGDPDTHKYYGPHGHEAGDGHPHEHDPDVAAEDEMHNHDPCKQVRMDYPGYEPVAPLNEVSPPKHEIPPGELIYDDGDPMTSEVFVGGEAYSFPIESGSFQEVDNLVISSDAQAEALAADGVISGTGEHDDPYVIENLIVGNALVVRDTSKCFVIRNNVVVDRVAEGPLQPPPGTEIIDLKKMIPDLEENITRLQALIDSLIENITKLDAEKALKDATMAQWDEDLAAMEDQLAALEAEKQAREDEIRNLIIERNNLEDEIAIFEDAYLDAVRDTEQLSSDFEYYTENILAYDESTITQPTRTHQNYISGGTITDITNIQSTFQAYQDEASAAIEALDPDDYDPNESVWDVRDMVESNEPGSVPPPDYPGNYEDWKSDAQIYDDYRQNLLDQIQGYWDELKPMQPDYDRKAALDEQIATKEAEYDVFMVDYNDFLVEYDAFMVDYNAAAAAYEDYLALYTAEHNDLTAQLDQAEIDLQAAQDLLNLAGDFAFKVGELLFSTLDDLLAFLLELVIGIIDPNDPNEVNNNNGQLVLDWNGQCMHVYNNVINDLRVNQNNDRTGEATGGITEQNRIFEIGQIRHYDGIFRQNEVGNRAHLYSLYDPEISAPAGRTVNNDGANQGWYFDNVFYGQIDLDFHGHHHSAGFFAPESHFHGSVYNVAYMVKSDGSCAATHDSVMAQMGHQHHGHLHADDNDWHVLGEKVIDRPDDENCLPHMHHGKRWTSVFFSDNVVIDPNGVGLRFEDENHRADDEQANSENMVELKKPHFHQKWLQIEDNAIVGKVFVDVLNAKGTFLWSDDWSEVENPQPGVERIQEAMRHPGARIVYSHPMRNDAWVDIQRNTMFLTQGVGVLVDDAEFLTRLQLKDNRGIGLASGLDPEGLAFEDVRKWFQDARAEPTSSLLQDLESWGGSDRGTQTFAIVRDAIDQIGIEFCGNSLDRVDKSLIATDRIYQDGKSTYTDCDGSNVLNGASSPAVSWTPAPQDRPKFSDPFRAYIESTDSYYILDTAADVADVLLPPAPVQV